MTTTVVSALYDEETLWTRGAIVGHKEQGAADFFPIPHVELFMTLATGGGVSDTVPSPKRHTNSYMKNTADV